MRLLNTATGGFEWFDDPRTVRYAILSHVWAKEGDSYFPEQTYKDIEAIQKAAKQPSILGWFMPTSSIISQLSWKIRRSCAIAREHMLSWIWIDSGCIDKSSTAEVSLAINSMFDWYRYATVCYAFLDDVHDDMIPLSKDSDFGRSRWFRRGWTLQELIAPHLVVFLSSEWTVIGTKLSLASVIEEITSVDRAVLTHYKELCDVPVARRMSWASRRETTLEEDMAYCLLGLFGVQMSPIYGEGKNAFLRLQETISQHIQDQTMLAWGARTPFTGIYEFIHQVRKVERTRPPAPELIGYDKTYLFATSPDAFNAEACAHLAPIPPQTLLSTLGIDGTFYPEYTTTAHGIRTRLPLASLQGAENSDYYLGFLACKVGRPHDQKQRFVALLLRRSDTSPTSAEFTVGFLPLPQTLRVDPHRPQDVVPAMLSRFYRLVGISDTKINSYIGKARITDLYIPYRPSHSLQARARDAPFLRQLSEHAKRSLKVDISQWCHDVLRLQGCYLRVSSESRHEERTQFVLDRKGDKIRIAVSQCQCEDGRVHGWLRATLTPAAQALPASLRYSTRIGHSACEFWQDHVYSWQHRDGVASQVYRFENPVGDIYGLRLTLAVEVEDRAGRSSTEAHRHYFLDIEPFNSHADLPPVPPVLIDQSPDPSPIQADPRTNYLVQPPTPEDVPRKSRTFDLDRQVAVGRGKPVTTHRRSLSPSSDRTVNGRPRSPFGSSMMVRTRSRSEDGTGRIGNLEGLNLWNDLLVQAKAFRIDASNDKNAISPLAPSQLRQGTNQDLQLRRPRDPLHPREHVLNHRDRSEIHGLTSQDQSGLPSITYDHHSGMEPTIQSQNSVRPSQWEDPGAVYSYSPFLSANGTVAPEPTEKHTELPFYDLRQGQRGSERRVRSPPPEFRQNPKQRRPSVHDSSRDGAQVSNVYGKPGVVALDPEFQSQRSPKMRPTSPEVPPAGRNDTTNRLRPVKGARAATVMSERARSPATSSTSTAN